MSMWTDEAQRAVETEALRIADSLLPYIRPAAIRAALEAGTCSTDLFNGIAGITLFFLRLYDHTRAPELKQACREAAGALLQYSDPARQAYYTLYTGATSLLYLCIKMYEVTGEDEYVLRATELAGRFEEGILNGVVQDDFISGHAGNIFVLTCLHAHTRDGRLPALIRRLTDKMILHARIAPQGLRWGHIKRSFDCLAGFSHGASGIAYGLMQAAQHFRDEGLLYLAEQALAYEMQYYDPLSNNWLDLRLTSTHLAETDIMNWQIGDFRKYASDTNSWAHGAAGVGLARLYAWQVTGREMYAQQAALVVRRSLEDARQLKRGDYTLCSGYGGIVSFFLQAAEILQQPHLRSEAQQIALSAVRYYQQHGTYNSYIPSTPPDPGLFSGLAGVGYMLADVLLPYRGDAITHPVICTAGSASAKPLYSPGEVKYRLFSRYYKTTIRMLELEGRISPGELCDVADIGSLGTLLQAKAGSQQHIADGLTLEQCETELWRQHKGLLCYTKRKEMLQTAAEALLQEPETLWLQRVFLPCAQVQLCYAGGHYILQSHEQGISTFPAGRLTAIIFNSLEAGRSLQTVIQHILETHFPGAEAPAREQVVQAVMAQVRSLLQQCLIQQQ